jgi:hypothetical protein
LYIVIKNGFYNGFLAWIAPDEWFSAIYATTIVG